MHLEDGGRCVSFIKQEGIKQVEVQKKERIFYLEFIRAFATLSIILTHYNALYIYMETPRLENTILSVFPFGIYIGNIWNPSWDGNIKTTYIGIAFFLVLVYLSEFFKKNHTVKYICAKICKYSYAIFLSHHLVIYEIAKKFDLNTIGYWGSMMLLLVCIEFIVLVAFGLFHLHRILMLEMKNASSQSI